ncbi:MAG TPA: hypothetical protein GXX64_10880 [Bacteroidales bacterium]|nr:hypothetical protein [Bacteroidales bacterium]
MKDFLKGGNIMIPALDEQHNTYISLAFVALKRTIPLHIRRDLQERGLHDDLEQEIAIIAYEGMQLYSLEGNDYLNFAGRRLYRFLRQNGYRRPRRHNSYVREDIGIMP